MNRSREHSGEVIVTNHGVGQTALLLYLSACTTRSKFRALVSSAREATSRPTSWSAARHRACLFDSRGMSVMRRGHRTWVRVRSQGGQVPSWHAHGLGRCGRRDHAGLRRDSKLGGGEVSRCDAGAAAHRARLKRRLGWKQTAGAYARHRAPTPSVASVVEADPTQTFSRHRSGRVLSLLAVSGLTTARARHACDCCPSWVDVQSPPPASMVSTEGANLEPGEGAWPHKGSPAG